MAVLFAFEKMPMILTNFALLDWPNIGPVGGGISSWDTTSAIFELNREDLSALAFHCLPISPRDFAKFVPI